MENQRTCTVYNDNYQSLLQFHSVCRPISATPNLTRTLMLNRSVASLPFLAYRLAISTTVAPQRDTVQSTHTNLAGTLGLSLLTSPLTTLQSDNTMYSETTGHRSGFWMAFWLLICKLLRGSEINLNQSDLIVVVRIKHQVTYTIIVHPDSCFIYYIIMLLNFQEYFTIVSSSSIYLLTQRTLFHLRQSPSE